MEKYRFSVDGTSVIIYPFHPSKTDREKVISELSQDELACIIYPDSVADFRVECFDKNNKQPREPGIMLAALFCFFNDVRAYPRMTLELEYNERILEIDLSPIKQYIFSVNGGKCKILYAKTLVFADGINIEYYILGGSVTCAALICCDCDLFDEAVLQRILSESGQLGARFAMAVSYSPGGIKIKSVGEALPSEAIACATVCISEKHVLQTGNCAAFIAGSRYDFNISRSRLTFYPGIKYLS